MSSPTLEARGVYKSYDEGKVEALRGADITIARGEFMAITGPSGSGKSTLLHMLGGLDSPTGGEVLFKNAPLGRAVDLDTYRSRNVGFIFQAFHLLPTLCAVDNVQLPMIGTQRKRAERLARAKLLLEEMGLSRRMMHYPSQLSAGERQRVAIARALANEPEILLADEPTGNLDSVNSAHIMEILVGIQKRSEMTLVIVTHEIEIAQTATRHIRFRDGKVEQ
jgi:ABC-type lipoprotein export system ATPase subunit